MVSFHVRFIRFSYLFCFLCLTYGFLFAQGGLSCNDQVQLSLDGQCEALPTAEMLLEGSYPDYSDFSVTVYQGVNAVPMPLGSQHIGVLLTARVVQLSTGNSCWSELEVLDLLPPEWNCPSDTLWFSCAEGLEQFDPPQVFDNCTEGAVVELVQESSWPSSCSPTGVWELIRREWLATDASGNTSSLCVQHAALYRPSLQALSFPDNLVLPCGSSQTDPAQTGYPELDGQPLHGQEGSCSLGVAFSDEWLEACGGGQYLLRSWSVLDWCAASGSAPLTHLQIIHLADLEPPQLVCPDSFFVAINEDDCSATFALPQVEVSDDCSSWSLSWSGLGFSLSANDSLVEHLPKGEYGIVYQATDACGNAASCQSVLAVRDMQAPVAICLEQTVVSLEESGQAEVPAFAFDHGSYDACSPIEFAARRMQDSLFTPTVLFQCEDAVDSIVQVFVQVRDSSGQVNACMVEVSVQDKLAPQLEVLPDLELSCYQDLQDTVLVGWPQVWDACGYELSYEESGDLDACGTGTIERHFAAVDPSGNSSSFVQSVVFSYAQPLQAEDINWPEDYQAPDCSSPQALSPDSLPAGYDRPTVAEQVCGLIAFSYEDALYDVAEPACFKIVRSWTIVDWCHYDPENPENGAVFTHEQIIKVLDETPPALVCPLSGFVKLTTPFCTDTVSIPPLQVEDCSPSIEILVSSELGEGFGPFPDVPLGDYLVNYTVTDGCGNSSSCQYTLRVVDAKKPTPYCKEALVITIMQTGMISVPVKDFDAGSFDNCTAQEDLQFSYSSYPGDTLRTFFCEDLGENTVRLWVFDDFGNADYCETYLEVQDPMEACQPFDFELGGHIATFQGAALPAAEVILSGSMQQELLTEEDGSYVFTNLPQGGDYTLRPAWSFHSMEGITTLDMVLISRHILQVVPFDSPYQLIAADVNGSGSVSSLDLVLIQRRILGVIDTFPEQSDWVFVPADYDFPDPNNPFSPPFPRVMNFNNLTASVEDADFIAVQLGNVSDY